MGYLIHKPEEGGGISIRLLICNSAKISNAEKDVLIQGEVTRLERRYDHLYEVLLESPLYEYIFKKGFDQGRQQAIQQNIQEAKFKVLRKAIVGIVQERFPDMMQFAEQQAPMINDLAHLEWLIVKVSVAASQEDTRRYLLTTDPATNINH